MKTILQINTSLFLEQGQSSRLAHSFVRAWQARYPEDRLPVRDLAKEPVPHRAAERFQALATPARERSAEQQSVAAYSDMRIDEQRQADVIVLGLPKYNFGMPSTLKAAFDHLARAGITVRYTENGPVGLFGGKTVHVLATCGSACRGTARDTQAASSGTSSIFSASAISAASCRKAEPRPAHRACRPRRRRGTDRPSRCRIIFSTCPEPPMTILNKLAAFSGRGFVVPRSLSGTNPVDPFLKNIAIGGGFPLLSAPGAGA